MADAGRLDGVLVLGLEEDAVIAATEPEFGAWRLEFFHVAGAGGQITVQAVQNLQGRFPVDAA